MEQASYRSPRPIYGNGYRSNGCPLTKLPTELIDHILSFLSPAELAAVCQTCHTLNTHASSDHIWQAVIQAHVPGDQVASPYPCASFKELYVCHDLRWFLPKYKLWFCGRDLTGRLVVVRYDQRRGCIEGYQLVAVSNRETFHHWPANDQVVIRAFEPEIKLHVDKPVLQLRAKSLENLVRQTISLSLSPPPSSSSGSSSGGHGHSLTTQGNRFVAETPMFINDVPDDTVFNNFLLAKPLAEAEAQEHMRGGFPYDNVWAPPAVPARHRVSSANFHSGDGMQLKPESRPMRRSEVSDQAFHVRTWLEMRQTSLPGHVHVVPLPAADAPNVHSQASQPWLQGFGSRAESALSPALHIGEEVATYATLDPHLYTPTEDKPWRGIWVGDYSSHGCEFLLIHQPDGSGGGEEGEGEEEEPFDERSLVQRADETDGEFARRRWEARVYRGRLEGIKLTGDPNVPRGEYTFIVDDLGEKGFVAHVREEPFEGTRIVKSRGHVAGTGFSSDRYIDSQLLLISPNRLAQYWIGYGHISFFERVDIDQFLRP